MTDTEKKVRATRAKLPVLAAEKKVLMARGIFRKLVTLSPSDRKDVLSMVSEYNQKSANIAANVPVDQDVQFDNGALSDGDDTFA